MAPSVPGLSSLPGTVTATEEEKKAGKLSPKSLQRAVELLHRDGCVVVDNIVDPEHTAKLKEWMLEEAKRLSTMKSDTSHFNQGIKSNFLMSPPVGVPELLYNDVYFNFAVLSIAEHYLGPDIKLGYISSNVAMASTPGLRQQVHKDTNFYHAMAPHLLTMQLLLNDFSPETGSTEVWLGSHAETHIGEQYWKEQDGRGELGDRLRPMGFIKPEALAERAATRPPAQVVAPMGSVILRDLRMWHAGMPNPSDEDRIMVGINYQPSWATDDYKFKLPLCAKPVLGENQRVKAMAEWVSDEEWNEKRHMTGIGEWNGLRYGPEMEREDVDWETVQIVVAPEEKVFHPTFGAASAPAYKIGGTAEKKEEA